MTVIKKKVEISFTMDDAARFTADAWGSSAEAPVPVKEVLEIAEVAADAYYHELEQIEFDNGQKADVETIESFYQSFKTFRKKWDAFCPFDKDEIHLVSDLEPIKDLQKPRLPDHLCETFDDFDAILNQFERALDRAIDGRKACTVPLGGKTRPLKAVVCALKEEFRKRGLRFTRGFQNDQIYRDERAATTPASKLLLSIALKLDPTCDAAACETAMKDQSVLFRHRELSI